jgi:uncharacterized protein (DUF885 family)
MSRRVKSSILVALLAFPQSLFAFQKPAPAVASANDLSDIDTSNSEMRRFIEAFVADRGNLQRYYNVESATETRERLRRYYTDWTTRLTRLNFDQMSQDGKVDYVLLRNFIEHELRKFDFDAKSEAEISVYAPFSDTIIQIEDARRKVQPMNAKETAGTLSKLNTAIEAAQRTVEAQLRSNAGADPSAVQKRRELGSRAARQVSALHNTLRTWYTFYDAYDPLFTWWAEEPYRSVDASLTKYEAFLIERVAGLRAAQAVAPATPAAGGGRGGGGRGGQGGGNNANFTPAAAVAGSSDDIIGNPIGHDGLMSELAFEMIPYTPEELIAFANKEFAWCENEMKKASREMGMGDDWKAALEKVKLMYVEPGKQPEVALSLAHQAEKFLDDHNLVTVPAIAHETWRMQMMPPAQQLVAPFFLGGETLLVAFPTSNMTYEQKMTTLRGNSLPFSHAVVFHELIPGHELQGYMAARYKSYRRTAFGGTPFLTEGWALHWELEMWDLGFHKTPEERIGALFWHMHRCARIIFSLSFHLGKMTPKECIDFLVDRVGFERENAAGEVRRSFGGGYGPLYQAAYLLGGIQIYSLQKEIVGAGKMNAHQFHDALLKENSIPVEMIRAAMTGQKLTRDYKTQWRFSTDTLGR